MATANLALQWLKWLRQHRQQAVRFIQDLKGLTACSQIITLQNGEHYILRQQTPRATLLGINYQHEAQILTAIAPLNIAPHPIYSDQNSSLLTWIEGTTPRTFTPTLLEKLATQLATLHQFPLQHGHFSNTLPQLNLAERCQYLWDKLPHTLQTQQPFSPPFNAIEPLDTALCHHDLHLGNLIEQGDTLFLIDWEYAALSDPALELALFLHNNPLSENEQRFFLACYFAKNRLDPTACNRKIQEYQPLIAKLNVLWYLNSNIENNSQKFLWKGLTL